MPCTRWQKKSSTPFFHFLCLVCPSVEKSIAGDKLVPIEEKCPRRCLYFNYLKNIAAQTQQKLLTHKLIHKLQNIEVGRSSRLSRICPKRFLSWGLKTLFASTSSVQVVQPSFCLPAGLGWRVAGPAARTMYTREACKFFHIFPRRAAPRGVFGSEHRIGFYLHKEF